MRTIVIKTGISAKALGLLLLIDQGVNSAYALEDSVKEGLAAVRTGLIELKEARLVEQQAEREDGKWAGVFYQLTPRGRKLLPATGTPEATPVESPNQTSLAGPSGSE